MKIGYIRFVQKEDEKLQEELLLAHGCTTVFKDLVLKKKSDLTGLSDAIRFLSTGNILIVPNLEMLACSMVELISVVNQIQEKQCELVSLKEEIDTRFDTAKIFLTLSRFQSNLIKSRTKPGLIAARSRGKKGGRPGLAQEIIDRAKLLHADSNKSISEICDELNIHPSTLYKYVNKRNTAERK